MSDAEPRNVLGGPKRLRNQNPGQGKGHVNRTPGDGGGSGPTAATAFKKIFGSEAEAAAAVTAAGAAAFKAWMTPEKRLAILDAMQHQAEQGSVQAANLLLNRDMGVPTASLDLTDKTPLKGSAVRAAVRKAVAAEREEMVSAGVDIDIFDRAMAAGIWRNEDEPEPPDAA